ncbi:MAG TPA: SpoIIE family protein phosphatase [Acidobacteriaceae bacterium]|jgi:serine phosphatase RsbU (regulator of sigma subunit)|nr:SpoIIE family protein phosphatase [Acidobacteriaceae bacterium]
MPAIVLSYSDSDGQHSLVLDRASISIGRSPDRDIVLHDALVSRQHAVITRDGEVWTISDQKSTHGTYLNSVRIQQEILKPGDVLQLGSLNGRELRLLVEQADQTIGPAEHTSLHDLLTSIPELREFSAETRPAREMEQLGWLLRAARQLNEGVAIDEILSELLQLTLQLTGVERGFVFLSTDGDLRFVQGFGLAGKITEEDHTISRNAIRKAVRSKSKFSVSDTMSDDISSGWSSVIVNEIRTIHCIPLRKRIPGEKQKQLLGLLYLDSRTKPGSLTEIDHQLLDTIATEAATLLQNALLAEAEQKARQAREELSVAAKIHRGLMSIVLPVLPYAELRAKSVPCLAIGGDFYDAVVLEDCVCTTIVDVSGKGVSAAIVAATLQGIIHAQLLTRQGLPEIAAVVNKFLYTRNVGKYATMVILKLFPDGRIEYINCGHLLPLVIKGKGIRRLEATNVVVGLIPGAVYTSAADLLTRGERLLLATDGITEAENNEGRQFDEIWLSAVTHCHNIGEILDQVAKFHAPNPAQDDCTLVEVRYTGRV